ncbi:cupin-like domain-containing protein [Arsukibacterium indicum]|uniref:Cupin-like domain-containing protein n=1 Tax=Arsukibacterium indicum TaxID=2848612 RepID=A0ABS6MMV2_9GAMM|nr:cupin-like domain-containing protein [Arsukibacterium indicum]MBV2130134.1 cupin-like domain-containing protein [Arsukibacterium indicum]
MPKFVNSWHNVTTKQWHQEIKPCSQPAVLRGFLNHWPIVQAATTSDLALSQYIAGQDTGKQVDTLLLASDTNGRIGYNAELAGFNYEKRQYPLSAILSQLFKTASDPDAVRIAAQSALVSECMPAFIADNPNPLLADTIVPRVWLGNKVMVPAHFDDADNLACVVAGKRTFTLFPPEQVANLYIGPLDYTPTGAPISLVDFSHPDFSRFPKVREALQHALVAELEPGDVLYIPALWWHQVESTAAVNLLVNYWWGGSIGSTDSRMAPLNGLLHSLLCFRELPPAQRQAWRAMYSHFLLESDDEILSHIPPEKRGIHGQGTFVAKQAIIQWLISSLTRLK